MAFKNIVDHNLLFNVVQFKISHIYFSYLKFEHYKILQNSNSPTLSNHPLAWGRGGGGGSKSPLAVGVKISADEAALLELPPNMCTYEILSEHVFEVDVEECMAKYRMSIHLNGNIDEAGNDDVELTAAEIDLFADIEAETRNPYNEMVMIYDVRKKNIRDIKQNAHYLVMRRQLLLVSNLTCSRSLRTTRPVPA